MTEYVILRRTERPDGAESSEWREVGPTVKASSPRRALVAANMQGGTYVALPYRSWKPLTVAVEQVTKISVS